MSISDSLSSLSQESSQLNHVITRNVSSSNRMKYSVGRNKSANNEFTMQILSDPYYQKLFNTLPSNYNFEVEKTMNKIKSENSSIVALQLPEGLLMYACILADIFKHFCKVKVYILSDVTYGACCVDDLTSYKLGVDLLIHYGHSCLVPLQTTKIKVY